jgi:hypothetical protein
MSFLILALGGIIQLGMGFYFLVLRPHLLPKDGRYLGQSFPPDVRLPVASPI